MNFKIEFEGNVSVESADIDNMFMFIEIEMVVKSDAKKFDLVCYWSRCTGNLGGSWVAKQFQSWVGDLSKLLQL